MSVAPDLPSETDVVVVGGGVIGASIAYFLTTETDREVTVVEKDSIGSGSTGDSSAIIRQHYGEKEIYSRMAWWSHQFYRQFEEVVGEPIAYEESRRVTFAEAETDTAEYAESGRRILEDLDIPVSRYEDDLSEEFPMFALDEFDFAVSDDAAAYSDGTDVAAGFARAVQQRGGIVVTGVAVEGFDVDDGELVGVDTEDGVVECEDVVIAAGPWTPRLTERLGVEVPVTPSREQVVILDPSEEYEAEYSPEVVPTAGLPGGYYVRSEFGEGVLIATHHSGDQCDPDDYDRPDEETLLDLHGTLTEYIPELEDAGVQGRYSGVYSNTPDHDFIIDQCGPVGCYVACGFSGHGFKQAPAVGKLVTDLVEDGESSLADLEFFSLSRFEADERGHDSEIKF